ncbi:MAG: hypothetical protein V1745_04945 [Patescibacteria group bacterium]
MLPPDSVLLMAADLRVGHPWAEIVASRRPSLTRPRVLFLGCRPDIDHYAGSKELTNICRKHGLRGRRMQYTRRAETFWNAFFGARTFLGRRVRYVPSLIVTTGRMRVEQNGMNWTFDVLGLIRSTADRWSIPLEVVPEIPYDFDRRLAAPPPAILADGTSSP